MKEKAKKLHRWVQMKQQEHLFILQAQSVKCKKEKGKLQSSW